MRKPNIEFSGHGKPNEVLQNGEIKSGTIKVINLDLTTGTWDTDSEKEKLLETVNELGLNPENMMYSGFSGGSLKEVMETGSYRPDGIIYCSTQGEFENPDGSEQSAYSYAQSAENPHMAILDPNHLDRCQGAVEGQEGGYAYKLKVGSKPSEAIKIIFKLKMN